MKTVLELVIKSYVWKLTLCLCCDRQLSNPLRDVWAIHSQKVINLIVLFRLNFLAAIFLWFGAWLVLCVEHVPHGLPYFLSSNMVPWGARTKWTTLSWAGSRKMYISHTPRSFLIDTHQLLPTAHLLCAQTHRSEKTLVFCRWWLRNSGWQVMKSFDQDEETRALPSYLKLWHSYPFWTLPWSTCPNGYEGSV